MKKNSSSCIITRINSGTTKKVNTIYIKNYRKFTYLIVELKCIINGIQRYFKTHDALKYYKKKLKL